MKKWSLTLSAVASSVTLGLMVARCVPVTPKSGASATSASEREATVSDISVHIIKEDPKNKGKYFVEFSTPKEIEHTKGKKAKISTINFCEIPNANSSHCSPLSVSKKAVADKTRQLFESSPMSIELKPGTKYTISALGADKKALYKSPRTIYLKKKDDKVAAKIEWTQVEDVLKRTCAGADCHYQSGGSSFTMPQGEWHLNDEKEFAAHKDTVKKDLESGRMPEESSESESLSATQKKLIIDYIGQLK